MFGASRLFTTHGVTIANGVRDIVPGLSFPVIVTNFGARKVLLRQRANVDYVEPLTTEVVQVPLGASHGTTRALAFEAAVNAEGVVGAVSGTRCDPKPGQTPAAAPPMYRGPVTPVRPQDPEKGGALTAAAPPAAPPQVGDVKLPVADPAQHDRVRCMLDQHKDMWTGQALGVIKATHHRIDLNAGSRPVRFAPRRAGHAAREAETAEVKRQLEVDVVVPTSSEWGFPIVLVPQNNGTLRFCVD